MSAELETRVPVHAAYYQYYFYGGDFDTSTVDMLNDGILAPGARGARIATGAHSGQVELTIGVVEHPIPLPSDPEAIAAACNVELAAGVAQITDWGGPVVFEHDFGRPISCGLLVQVFGRDEAFARQYKPETPPARERHRITISSAAFPQGRWRSVKIDSTGSRSATYTAHVAPDH
jgi:hypothetical protein